MTTSLDLPTPPRAPLLSGCVWCYQKAGIEWPADATSSICPGHYIRFRLAHVARHPEWRDWVGLWLFDHVVVYVASPRATPVAFKVDLDGWCAYERLPSPNLPRVERSYEANLERQVAALEALLRSG